MKLHFTKSQVEASHEVAAAHDNGWARRITEDWLELQTEVERLRAKDASLFQPEPHTEDKTDKWLILALRILSYIERDDVAEGLEAEVERLRTKLKERGIEEAE